MPGEQRIGPGIAPGRIGAGSRSALPTLTMDWMPTLLQASGVAAHPDCPLDGIRLMPLCDDTDWHPARQLHWRMKHRQQASTLPGIPDDADVHLLEDESCMPRPTH